MKDSKTLVEQYMKKSDWRVKENSSSPFMFGGLSKYIIGEVSKDYWLNEVYPFDIAKSYIDGHIHIHDLGGLTLYCCGYSLKDILLKGVKGVQNIPTSKPAKHFDSILNQISNLTTIFQNEIMGAVAFNGFDTLLAPFIKNDKLSYDEVKQSMQNFIFSINSNSRAGAEPAFTNITFDLTPPEDMLNEYAIIGGEPVSFTYGKCQQEMDLLNRVFFEIMLQGDADGKLFSYPIPTYNIHKRFDWDNPNNKMLWEMAGKYGTPYFANFINSELDIKDVRSMCPLGENEKVLVMNNYNKEFRISTIKNLYDSSYNEGENLYSILLDGEIKKAKVNKFPGMDFYKITTVNGHTITLSADHLNLVYKGYIKKTKELTTEDYLPFSIKSYLGDESLTYDDGLMVGAFMGDGSMKDDSIIYSLNKTTKLNLMNKLVSIATTKYGAKVSESILKNGSCVNVSFRGSSMLSGLIKDYVRGKALDKEILMRTINRSLEFRNGIIDGLIQTDGTENKKRIYTSSYVGMNSIVTLLASMGIPTRVTIDDRPKSDNGKYADTTIYCIRLYSPSSGHDKYGEIYKKDDEYMWFKISSIEPAASKYGYCFEVMDDDKPYFMMPNGIVTHNCRLKLNLKELRHRNGGLFGSGDSTGSIGVVTLNLPRIAYENKGNKESFFNDLDKYLIIAKDSLEIKRKWLQENVIETNLIPAYIEYVGTLRNHFSTIGIVGMNEMCENFMGKNILDDEAHKFCIEVGNYIRNKLLEFQEETGNLYNYEATPAESTCYRFALLDKRSYPDIITQGSGDEVYYTNSCHIPVKMIKSIDSTFKHQNDLQIQFTGGTVIHCYLEGAINGDQAKSIVYAMLNKYEVPYMSLSPISRYCSTHGYIKEHTDECPRCHERLKKYQRVTGYLRCVDNFNAGKTGEFKDRVQL